MPVLTRKELSMPATEPFDLVLFGGSGDLATRKLLPALYYRDRDESLHPDGRIICVSRGEETNDAFIAQVKSNSQRVMPDEDFDSDSFDRFARRLQYVGMDVTKPEAFDPLADLLKDRPDHVRVFFFATSPSLFGVMATNLKQSGCVTEKSRVVLEKPLGHDLQSCIEINQVVGEAFDEQQIYRIDHYLGKETVQNLMALRFGNALFEPLWRGARVRDVQITVAEQIGVGGRAGYYDHSGALRDMIQNHLLQLLSIVAMEPPQSLNSDAIRDEKLKVLRALRPIEGDDVSLHTVRGQYQPGAINGQAVPGYLQEDGVAPDSLTETFVALRCQIENWRWAGVPFYLRTGKRLMKKLAEIVINFHPVPHDLFASKNRRTKANRLIIRLQPDEGVMLQIVAKHPGDAMELRPVNLNLDFAQTFQIRAWDAYERLLMDVLNGKLTLFLRRDETEQAWRWIEPILEGWANSGERPEPYVAGTWGPAQSARLIGRDGFRWHEET